MSKHKWLYLLVAFALLLAACQPAAPTEAPEAPPEEPMEPTEAPAEPTEPPEAPEEPTEAPPPEEYNLGLL
jgi:PBP1b-binding outer membrane lipoprotein LpoB